MKFIQKFHLLLLCFAFVPLMALGHSAENDGLNSENLNLFLLVEGQEQNKDGSLSVKINHDLIFSKNSPLRSAKQKPVKLKLNLPVIGETIAIINDSNYSTQQVRSHIGKIEGKSGGKLFLTVMNKTFHGLALLNNGRKYYITKSTGNTYAVKEKIDSNLPARCGTCEASSHSSARKLEKQSKPPGVDVSPKNYSLLGGPVVVDVLAVYTEKARKHVGNKSQEPENHAHIKNLYQTYIDITNTALKDSDVDVKINVVHMEEIDYEESEEDSDLSKPMEYMKDYSDGIMDELPALRAKYKPDLVSLVAAPPYSTTAVGRADKLISYNHITKLDLNSVINVEYCGELTLAHELGHNFGCSHDRDNASSEVLYDYAYGHKFKAVNSTGHEKYYTTIMSYSTKLSDQRIVYFSNPDIKYLDVSTGVKEGQPDSANNAKVIRQTAAIVARSNSSILKFEVHDRTATITDCKTSATGDLVIPSTYEGMPIASIGDWAFNGCSSLTSVTIPNSVTTIGDNAFADCSSLTSIEVVKGNTEYSSEDGVLFDKSKTRLIQFPAGKSGHYTIPNSVTTIGSWAFDGCSGLTSVKIGDSVTTISKDTFYDCTNLKSVTIPDSVIRIGLYAFKSLTSLTSIEVVKGNTEYSSEDGVLFDKNKTRLIQFPAGKNGHYTIPDSVTSIGNNAFSYCSSLTGVTMPDSVTNIADAAFYDCSSLTSIEVVKGNTEYSSEDGVLFDKNKTRLIQFPAGKNGHYTIPDSVTSIGNNAFYYCSSLTSVTIGQSVISIEDWAFGLCSNLTRITFDGDAPSLGDDVFIVVAEDAKIFVSSGATGFGETFGGLPVARVVGDKPKIILQPQSTSVPLGMVVETLVVTAKGENLKYQWYKDNLKIVGATKSTYVIFATFSEDVGEYYVTVSNESRTVTSETAVISLEKDETVKISSFKYSGQFQFDINGMKGATFLIEASADLKLWAPVGEFKNRDGVVKFSDRTSPLFDRQFYRVKVVE